MIRSPGPRPAGGPPTASDRARRRRVARARRAAAARIAVCDSAPGAPVLAQVRRLGYRADASAAPEELLRGLAGAPVDLAIVTLGDEPAAALGLLALLRRAAPRTPLVLVVRSTSPALRLRLAALRPLYVAVAPVAAAELGAVIAGALAGGRRRA